MKPGTCDVVVQRFTLWRKRTIYRAVGGGGNFKFCRFSGRQPVPARTKK